MQPESCVGLVDVGHVVSQAGRHEGGLRCTVRARELDPLGPMTHAMSSQVAFQSRDYRSAFDHARRALAAGSNRPDSGASKQGPSRASSAHACPGSRGSCVVTGQGGA
jgi:hypothetical protein